MKRINFQVMVCIERDGPGFHAFCPALKGLHVPGDTIEEAKKNFEDAFTVYMNSIIKRNDPIPLGLNVREESECMHKMTPKPKFSIEQYQVAFS